MCTYTRDFVEELMTETFAEKALFTLAKRPFSGRILNDLNRSKKDHWKSSNMQGWEEDLNTENDAEEPIPF